MPTKGTQAFAAWAATVPPMKPAALSLGLILAQIFALAGCAELGLQQSAQQQSAALATPIAPSELDWSRKSGANTVTGLALIEAGGATHTCAGQQAVLIPDSTYARARMTAIFGNATSGMRAASQGPVKFERDDPLYVSTLRTAGCDAAGSFSFPRVPDGVWYVTTSVKWQGDAQVEGGSLMQRVDVRGGRMVKVVLGRPGPTS
jgi:hypothetical protein